MTEDGQLQERILLEGKCYIATHGWMSLPVSKNAIRYASTLAEIHVSYKDAEGEGGTGHRALMGLSFGGVMQITTGSARVDISYYGEDEDHFYRHVTSHLRHTLSVCPLASLTLIIRRPIKALDTARVAATLTSNLGEQMRLVTSQLCM